MQEKKSFLKTVRFSSSEYELYEYADNLENFSKHIKKLLKLEMNGAIQDTNNIEELIEQRILKIISNTNISNNENIDKKITNNIDTDQVKISKNNNDINSNLLENILKM